MEAGELRHLLLGNGFSIACRPDLFRYDSLLNQADFSHLETAREAFNRLETTNFETVIRALRSFSIIGELYSPSNSEARESAIADADSLREVLVRAIADSHPDRPHEMDSQEYLSCRNFCRGYTSINTLNYDLLIYWAMMQNELGDGEIKCDDGFRKPSDDPSAEYVSWDPDNSPTPTLRYLHGALHIFDTGTELKKFTWINTQIPLVDQIREALSREFYPLFVSEGKSSEKLDRIRHSDYLCKMYRSFSQLKGSIVVYGHSLDECDKHIFNDRIGRRGKTKNLFVSLFGDPASKVNQEIIHRASGLVSLRSVKWPLTVKFFDAASASVWTG